MNMFGRLAWFSVTAILLALLPLRAQNIEVPRTRTLPGIELPAFPYAQPEEVGLSAEKLSHLGNEITRWAANGDLVGAELLIIKEGRAVFHEAYGWADREEPRPCLPCGGSTEDARRSYARAAELAEQRDDDRLPTYQANLEQMTQQLEGQ